MYTIHKYLKGLALVENQSGGKRLLTPTETKIAYNKYSSLKDPDFKAINIDYPPKGIKNILEGLIDDSLHSA